jgi:hypothetical protein
MKTIHRHLHSARRAIVRALKQKPQRTDRQVLIEINFAIDCLLESSKPKPTHD